MRVLDSIYDMQAPRARERAGASQGLTGFRRLSERGPAVRSEKHATIGGTHSVVAVVTLESMVPCSFLDATDFVGQNGFTPRRKNAERTQFENRSKFVEFNGLGKEIAICGLPNEPNLHEIFTKRTGMKNRRTNAI